MKRFLAIILALSLIVSGLVFAPGITSAAASPVTGGIYGETLEVTDVSSFRYAVPKLATASGSLTTQLVKNTAIKQPLHNITEGWDGTYVISSIDGSVTGPVVSGAQESITLQWINRTYALKNNTIMFYVELPDYAKAGANWALNINSLYILQDGTNFYTNRSEGIEYSYLSASSDKWEFATTAPADGALATFNALPSGFKGYVRIDISSVTFWGSGSKNADLSEKYHLVNLGFGYNAVGGECGELRFGGIFYYPEDDKCTSTLLSSRGKHYYQLGGSSEGVLVATHYPRYNVKIHNPSGGTVEAAVANSSSTCPGGAYAVEIDSTTGAPITSEHMYEKMWPNIAMNPTVDTFMIYVELPTFESDTPALSLAMPGISQNGIWPLFADTKNVAYTYLDINKGEWENGVTGTAGELSELGSGFKGYIKFDLKDFEFFGTDTNIKRTIDFTKSYNIECIQLRFKHVGGENGKLLVGSLYSVLRDSDVGKIVTTSLATAAEYKFSVNAVTSMEKGNPAIAGASGEVNSELSRDTDCVQAASKLASGYNGAIVVSSKNGAVTSSQEAVKLSNIGLSLKASEAVMFYVELPCFEKAGADWGLKISALSVSQNGALFTATAGRTEYSYLPLTGKEWLKGVIKENGVLGGLESGFKGYIILEPTDFDYNKIGGTRFDVNSEYALSDLELGFNAVGEEAGNLVLGGIFYTVAESYGYTTDVNILGRYHKLTESPYSMAVTAGGARYNVSITNNVGGEVGAAVSYFTADCNGRLANTSARISSTTGDIVTDLHMYTKLWPNIDMTPGVDTFMVYIEMPEYTETEPTILISQPAFAQNGGSDVYIDWTNGRYSYMSIFDGEWKSASLGTSGALSALAPGFKGYVKFDLKDFSGFETFRTKIDTTAAYTVTNVRFRFRNVGGDNGDLVIGSVYAVNEDSNEPYITAVNKKISNATRFVYGDIVANGEIDADDLAVARKVILGADTLSTDALSRSDANLDKVNIDIKDIVRMKKVIAGAVSAEKWADRTNTSSLTVASWLEGGQIPYYTEGTVTLTETSDNTTVMTAVGTTAATYNEYLKALVYAGFDLYSENTSADNLFATYKNSKLAVHTYYIASNSTARIIFEPLGMLQGLEEENVYDTSVKVDTRLTAIDLSQEPKPEGMSFLIRLEDGSFIVIDGGFQNGSASEATKLYNQLVAQSPEGEKPVIAAWIFTHAHNDHIGNFNEFSMHYSDDVELQRIVYNFPSEEELLSNSPHMLGSNIGEYATFKRVLAEYYSDVPITKAHTGNRFYVRNAEFEVMQTFEDFYPANLADYNFNTTSVIYRMQLEGQSFMWMGDSTPASEAKLTEQFGSYIKSDVLQLSHHGIDGTLAAYQVIDPEYVLWGAAKQFYYQYASSEANNWLLFESENVKQVMVTGFGTYTVKLPINITGEYPEHLYANDYVNPSVYQ